MSEVPIMCTPPPDGLVRRLSGFEALFTGEPRRPLPFAGLGASEGS
jgi:hypothetical protein